MWKNSVNVDQEDREVWMICNNTRTAAEEWPTTGFVNVEEISQEWRKFMASRRWKRKRSGLYHTVYRKKCSSVSTFILAKWESISSWDFCNCKKKLMFFSPTVKQNKQNQCTQHFCFSSFLHCYRASRSRESSLFTYPYLYSQIGKQTCSNRPRGFRTKGEWYVE